VAILFAARLAMLGGLEALLLGVQQKLPDRQVLLSSLSVF